MLTTLRTKAIAAISALSLLFLGTALASPASAAHVSCGDTITQSVTLDANVGPCAEGINITANNIVVDLNGFTITGDPEREDSIGIGLDHVTGVMVRGGRVTHFGIGIYIQGGGNNFVIGMTSDDNMGVQNAGDGIVIDGSNSNGLRNNVVRNNGPFDGIGVINGASFNRIDRNTIVENNIITPGGPQQTHGVRIEGPGSNRNFVTNNIIEDNGLDGVGVFRATTPNMNNVIRGNFIAGNGFHQQPHRRGNGVVLFGSGNPAIDPTNTLVDGNVIIDNAASGIRVESQNNRIFDNYAIDNGSGALVPGTAFDLLDVNPNCDANIWRGNFYETASPPCTTIRGTQVGASQNGGA